MTLNSISGIVEDENFKPVDGATVALMLQSGGTVVEYTATDANGFYEFTTHNDSTVTEQQWHVAVYDDQAPIYNDFSKPFITAVLNNQFGEFSVGTSYGGRRFEPFTVSRMEPSPSNKFEFFVDETGGFGVLDSMTMKPDGSRFHIITGDGGGTKDESLLQLDCSVPSDFSTATITAQTTYETVDEFRQSITWADSGNKFYEVANFNWVQYSASTPYDITTLTLEKKIENVVVEGKTLKWNDDGTRFFSPGLGDIDAYDAQSPYDIENATFAHRKNGFSRPEYQLVDIAFSNDGMKLFEMYDGPPSVIVELALQAPYDVSGTTTEVDSFDGLGNELREAEWLGDGTILYDVNDSRIQAFRV